MSIQIVDINGQTRECIRIVPDKDFPGFMKVLYKSKNRKGYSHSEWYAITNFVKNNPKLKDLTKNAPKEAKEDLGVVTGAKESVLSDRTKKWEKNIFAGNTIWISRGKGEGQTRIVLANDKNTVTIDHPWKEIPDKTSQYLISFNVHDPQVRGNTLPPIIKEKKRPKINSKIEIEFN
ncbi:MAG: hypothetical protein COU25_02650 [Candidatus Levybacteria bacterium CG10_big_fil_rev_8_21_14_0_10_35_13]|nr:MAG: hypothetical protein COU25_02650 [Candidatus Levybacteria bacterium CG10_big_fil_rev_8_21_14_0_10_35_13]